MAENITRKAYTLNDVSIGIKVDGTDGEAEIIGMITAVKVDVKVTQTIIHEAGKQGLPVARVFTKKEISGSFDRTLVSTDVLKKLWESTEVNPSIFDLQGLGIGIDSEKNFTVADCAIDGFPLELDLDNATTQNITFMALNFSWDN